MLNRHNGTDSIKKVFISLFLRNVFKNENRFHYICTVKTIGAN
jgi:hypothetical protein